jgi:hypothetical protein
MPALIWTTKFVATIAAAVVIDSLVKNAASKWTLRKA